MIGNRDSRNTFFAADPKLWNPNHRPRVQGDNGPVWCRLLKCVKSALRQHYFKEDIMKQEKMVRKVMIGITLLFIGVAAGYAWRMIQVAGW